jgi:phage protein U
MTQAGRRSQQATQTKTPIILLLGEYAFSDWDAPQGWNYKESAQYAKHDVLDGKPKIQYVGDSLQTLSLKFRLHHGWCNPDAKLALLQGMKDSHLAYPLQIGSGVFRGNYVLTDVNVDLKLVNDLGKVRLMEVSVELLEDITPPAEEEPEVQNPFSKKG